MLEDKQTFSGDSGLELWVRGRLWEIFGFTSGDFTALELAAEYSRLGRLYKSSPKETQILEDAFAILNAPLTRRFYEGCRMEMKRMRCEIGDDKFEQAESKIWTDLWDWVSRRWQPPPEELMNAIKIRYRHPVGAGAAASTSETPVREVSWFGRHLNWTAILIGLAIPLLGVGIYVLAIDVLVQSGGAGGVFVLGTALLVATIWVILWLLKKKHRSWSWSLLVFLPYIGWFSFIAVYLSLKKRSQTLQL